MTGHLKNKEEKNQIKEQEKTIRQLEERYQRVNREYVQLKEMFGLTQDSDFTSSTKFK